MAKLYVVGTPIGNLKDITYRAVEILQSADVVACEDTRHSKPLLAHYGVKARLLAYHNYNEQECASKLVDLVKRGLNVALITDAGMPCVSDPGAEVVALCRSEGLDVESVPGPTAAATAVAVSGVKAAGFVFLGFLPDKKSAFRERVENADKARLPLVIYCAPHDVKRTAAALNEILGDRKVFVVRELTKLHECVEITSLNAFSCEERGEIVLVVESAQDEGNELSKLSPEEHLRRYLDAGMDKKEAVKKVASERGVPKNDIYRLIF